MSTRSSVGTLLVHVPLKLHLFFSVMNNDNNVFSHPLMTTFVHVAKLSMQRFICGSASEECKRGCSSFICYETFPYQFQHRNTEVGRRDKAGLKNKKKTENFNRVELPLQEEETNDRKYLANTDIARKVDPRRVLNCQSFLLWNFAILHFVLGSHLILERNMSSLCLLVFLKSKDASFKGYFDKIFLIKLQHEKLKSVLFTKMTRCS